MKVLQGSALRNQYKLIRDSFDGQGGYADNSYLTKYDSEPDFNKRAEESKYHNLLGPIVEARVDPCFTEAPTRTYSKDPLLESFLLNADNNGTPLDQIIQESTLNTVLLGNDVIVMDNFPVESEMSLEEVVNARKYPYIYRKSVSDIHSYEVDPWGKLLEITFYWGQQDPNDKNNKKHVFKRFDSKSIKMLTMTPSYAVAQEYDPKSEEVTATTEHGLGKCPVVYYNSKVQPFSKYYAMARQSKHLFNASSRLGELNKDQSLSILTIQGRVPEGGLDIGANNALIVDEGVQNMPDYISPDAGQMTVSLDYCNSLKDDIIQAADVLGTTAIGTSSSSATSGAQEAYRFFGKAQALRQSSVIASYLDKGVIDLLGMFLSTEYDYEVKYQDQFAPTFNDTNLKYGVLEKVLKLNLSNELNTQIGKDITSIVGGFMGWPDDVLTGILNTMVVVASPAPEVGNIG